MTFQEVTQEFAKAFISKGLAVNIKKTGQDSSTVEILSPRKDFVLGSVDVNYYSSLEAFDIGGNRTGMFLEESVAKFVKILEKRILQRD